MVRAALLTLLLSFPAAAGDVNVFAAASLTDAIREIAGKYAAVSRDRILFNFAGSNTLARQIAQGAPADLFVSADAAQMDILQRRGAIDHSSRRSIASNRLVVVIARDANSINAQHLTTSRVRSIAVADPRGVPAGVYAKAWLQNRRMWGAVSPKLIPTENVRAALAAVEAGNADAAIVYRSDARGSRRTRVAFEIPANETPVITYPAALVRGSANAPQARRFLDYLSSAAAREVFLRHGFL